MTWIKLDDNAVDHPKVETLSDRAFRWWVKGLSYASRFLTNGVLPPIFWKKVPTQSRAELTTHRLWDWVDPNFHIHDYLAHQSSKETVSQKKADTAERVRKFREAKRNALQAEQCNALPSQVVTRPVTLPDTEIRDQIQRSENREQNVPPPLISGEASPKAWGKIHGDHVTGFCDWVCLPDFIFTEFCRKSGHSDKPDGGADYVRGWAAAVRCKWTGPVGDNLKFWRDRWAESHVTAKVVEPPKHRGVAEILAEREAKKAGRAS